MNPNSKPLPNDLIITTVDKDKFEQKVKLTPVAGKVIGFDANGKPVNLGAMFSALETKTDDYTVTASDRGKVILCVPSANDISVNLGDPAARGAGWLVTVANGSVTDTYSVKLADLISEFPLYAAQAVTFISTGSNWLFFPYATVNPNGPGFPSPRWNGSDCRMEFFEPSNASFETCWTQPSDNAWTFRSGAGVLTMSMPPTGAASLSFLGGRDFNFPDYSGTVATLGVNSVPGNTGSISSDIYGGHCSVTPAGSMTINVSAASLAKATAGSRVSIVVTTSGTTSYTVTFGTNFKSTGTLSTGTVSGKVFTVSFVFDGINWCETGRTTAM